MKIKRYESKEAAKAQGVATFNDGEHVYVDAEQTKRFTVSVKTYDGQEITFAFIPHYDGVSMECVDIDRHGVESTEWIVGTGPSKRAKGLAAMLLHPSYDD